MDTNLGSKQYLIEKIRLRDFRCFRKNSTIPLTPLTFLVGENSTGKTSFLAAIRTIWETAFRTLQPNFREEPYDLGSFSEIVHHSNPEGMLPSSFEIGFSSRSDDIPIDFDVTFAPGASALYPSSISVRGKNEWIRTSMESGKFSNLEFSTKNGTWRYPKKSGLLERFSTNQSDHYWSADHYGSVIFLLLASSSRFVSDQDGEAIESIGENQAVCGESDIHHIAHLLHRLRHPPFGHIFAGAPIRSRPHRIYDPTVHSPDPSGSHVPAFLAEIVQDEDQWRRLKAQMEQFGRSSGLFHEIRVRRFENSEGSPFRLEVSLTNGERRNLIDVGYGISQILPVIYELFRQEGSPVLLLQQPEVHLHPSAQAALGTLFCEIASSGRQIIVETHSDYTLDRVLLDIRDKRTELTADNVSVLFFKTEGGHASIHPIRIDDEGNLLDTPDGYRKFFKKELDRLINY